MTQSAWELMDETLYGCSPSFPRIMLEGPDACGKTTASKAFNAFFTDFFVRRPQYRGFKAQYCHLRPSKYLQQMQMVALSYGGRNPTVIDRHWVSQQIYSLWFGGKIDHAWHRFLHLMFYTRGGYYFFFLPESPEAGGRFWAKAKEERHELYDNHRDMVGVAALYRAIVLGTNDDYEYACALQPELKHRLVNSLFIRFYECGGMRHLHRVRIHIREE